MRRSPAFTAAAAFTLACAAPAAAQVTVFRAPEYGDLSVDLYGWIQPRFTAQQHDDRPQVMFDPEPAFTVQRARFGTVGKFGELGRLQLEVDFAGNTVTTLDAYAVLAPIHEKDVRFELTFGQFRVPFSGQNLRPSSSFQLPDVAYFIAPSFIVDRNIGAKMGVELWNGKLKLEAGVFNANDPGRGQTINVDGYFLAAARFEIAPLGRVPNFEGDLRPLYEQHHFVFRIAGNAMRDRFPSKDFDRKYVGGDISAWWYGASLYGEVYYHVDSPAGDMASTAMVRQAGYNIQAGYFPPVPWVREHLEAAVRVEYFDPALDVQHPTGDAGAMDLNQSNPTWGYRGYIFGLNYFLNHKHTLKAQASYEVRNETKQCLMGQTLPNCTGYIRGNLFVAQITAGF
jgi:Phosphate-selective porin O and P